MIQAAVLQTVLGIGETMLNRWFPDPEKRAQAEREFLLSLSADDMKKALAQLEVNAREAAHPSVWVSGWRPFVGWVSGLGFVWATIGQPVVSWVSLTKGWPVPPAVDSEILLTVLFGMLGLGTLRSVEKVKGATK